MQTLDAMIYSKYMKQTKLSILYQKKKNLSKKHNNEGIINNIR